MSTTVLSGASSTTSATTFMWQTELSYASPVFRAVGVKSGQEVRERRDNRSSSSNSSIAAPRGEFIVETFRAGGPYLCQPPVTSVAIPDNNLNYQALCVKGQYLKDEIMSICRRKHIKPIGVQFVCRKDIASAGHGDTTALVSAKLLRTTTSEGWGDVARQIWAWVRSQDSLGVKVELLDPSFTKRPFLFPCNPSDKIWPMWTEVGMRILERIELHDLISLGCYRIGDSNNWRECPPTVLVSVNKRSTREWTSAREKVVQLLDWYELKTVAVVFRRDVPLPTAGFGFQYDVKDISKHCTPGPKPGVSLAPRATKDANGTLGGFIQLEWKKTKTKKCRTFAMTCAHCVYPTDAEIKTQVREERDLTPEQFEHDGPAQTEAEARKAIIARYKDEGTLPGVDMPYNLFMNSPSTKDLVDGIQELKDDIKDTNDKPVMQRCDGAMAAYGEIYNPKDKAIYDQLNPGRLDLRAKKETLDRIEGEGKHHFGRVFASSGLRQVQGVTTGTNPNDHRQLINIDWALIEPESPRTVGTNKFTTYPIPSGTQAVTTATGFWPAADSLVAQHLYKVGRRTGFTESTYGGCKEAKVARKIIQGQQKTVYTWEHTVVSPSDHSFILGGDSGAWLMSPNGKLVGVCFAGSEVGERAYFTHIEDVLRDIQRVTNADTIRLPLNTPPH